MNYNAILEALNQASLFELHRLNAAIRNQLEDPARIRKVKQVLRVGQTVTWFDEQENRLLEARLLEIRRTRALVQNIGDGKRWNIQFYLINVDNQDIEIAAQGRRKLDRNSLSVGDRVAFKDRHGHERFGEVVKLNPKSAAVMVGTVRWRVAYGLLMPVIDGDLGSGDPLALPGHFTRLNDDGPADDDSSILPTGKEADTLIPVDENQRDER
jgi:hypothetical protein